jgi:hypothetical protein
MSLYQKIFDRIKKNGRGVVYCMDDFLDLGTRNAVGVSVFRLVKKGVLKNTGPGIYVFPKKSDLLGDLSPDLDSVLKSYARKNRCLITPSPLSAAHSMNLTTQVPAQLMYLTDGISRTLNVEGIQIKFVHACPKKLAGAGKKAGLIIQVLQYFGGRTLPDSVLTKITANMNKADYLDLKEIRLKTMKNLIPSIDQILLHA